GMMLLGRLLVRQPGLAILLLREAVRLYGSTGRAVRAWLRALPLQAGRFNLVHFVYSGLAVSYRDVLPLLHGPKILMSCRGAAEQITPFVLPERAAALKQVFEYMDRVHCVSDDMLRTVASFGLDPGRAF